MKVEKEFFGHFGHWGDFVYRDEKGGYNMNTKTHILIHRPFQGIECSLLSKTDSHSIIYAEGKLYQVPNGWIKELPKKYLQKPAKPATLKP